MIYYSPGYWNVCFSFSLKGSVFPKSFVWAAGSSILCIALHLWIANHEEMRNAGNGVGEGGTNILGGFMFILGFLVVFRSQQAYSRWWEGGTLMQQLRGEWFNATSCLVAFCNTETAPEKHWEVLKFQHQLVRLVSLLYASALQQICTMEDKRFYMIDITGFEKESLEFLQSDLCHDHCEVVLQWIQRLVVQADKSGVINIAPPILSRVYNQLGNGIVNLNNARKITEFPIPFPLAQMITVMLLFHSAVLPLICATTIKTAWWSATINFVVVFSYWSINYIATELEMPFGDDPNDLPLHDMQADLNASLITLLQEKAGTCPKFEFKDSDIQMLLVKVDPAHLDYRPEDKPGEPLVKVKKARPKHRKFPVLPSPAMGWPKHDRSKAAAVQQAAAQKENVREKKDATSPQVQSQQWSQAATNIHQVNLISPTARGIPGVAGMLVPGQGSAEAQSDHGNPFESDKDCVVPQQLGSPSLVLHQSWPKREEKAAEEVALKMLPQPAQNEPQAAGSSDPFTTSNRSEVYHHHYHHHQDGSETVDSRQPASTNRSQLRREVDACCLPIRQLTNQTSRSMPVVSSASWRSLQNGAVV